MIVPKTEGGLLRSEADEDDEDDYEDINDDVKRGGRSANRKHRAKGKL